MIRIIFYDFDDCQTTDFASSVFLHESDLDPEWVKVLLMGWIEIS